MPIMLWDIDIEVDMVMTDMALFSLLLEQH
jgi:hypothetical protein